MKDNKPANRIFPLKIKIKYITIIRSFTKNMKINIYTNNCLQLEGRVTKVREYSENKAANVTIAVEPSEQNAESSYIQTKSFSPSCYNTLKPGMKIRVFGHITQNSYTKKSGEKVYATDVIADFIEFLEAKSVVEAREAAKIMF